VKEVNDDKRKRQLKEELDQGMLVVGSCCQAKQK
jgi:hypothetical protein